MPNLTERPGNEFAKLMFIGDSGSGKTGSLVSLVKAGYKLRVLDMDNGLDSLVGQIRNQCPDKMSNVSYMTFRDEYQADVTKGLKVSGRARAYVHMLKALNEWEDGTTPAEWGADTVFVLDSLTAVGKAAYNWAESLDPMAKDKRQWFFSAQQSVETLLDMLTGDSFRTNVIVISHVNIVERPDGSVKGYASAIGSALGPKIPKFFNTLVAAESRGIGDNVKRTIQTRPTTMLDLKVPDEEHVGKQLSLNTGMLEIFNNLRGELK